MLFNRRDMSSRLLFALLCAVSVSARAGVAVLTQHNDLSRTGANLQETVLNASNVAGTNFGLVCARPVDDQIYAQPLVMTNVSIPGQGVHNIVVVGTVNDTVYAFDADDTSVTAPYWTNNLAPASEAVIQNVDMRRHHRPRFSAESSGCVTIFTVILAALSSLNTCATTSQIAPLSARTYTACPR